MKCFFSFLFFFGFTTFLFGQNIALDSTTIDDKYREDQFYISVTYNLLGSKPEGVSQNGFSSGFHLGFIRDMPINKTGMWLLVLDLGYQPIHITRPYLYQKIPIKH